MTNIKNAKSVKPNKVEKKENRKNWKNDAKLRKKFLSLIPDGEENAIKAKYLANKMRTSTRAIVALVESLRLEGYLIASTKANGGGYYYPATKKEVIDYLARMERETNSHICILTAQKKRAYEKFSISA